MSAIMRIPTEFTAIDKFTSVVSKMTSGVSNFSKSTASAVTRVNTKVNGLLNSMDSMSQLALGGGIVAGFGAAGKAVMDYETALASLEAVTGESSSKFKGQIEAIAKSTNKSAIDVAGSFEIIGSAMSQYLSDPKALGQISNAGITLSKASRMELEPALASLTSVMNQFNLGAKEATKTVNILTAGEIVGSVSTEKIANSLQEFGANAFAANVKLSESVALLETMGKQMDHSKIGIGARNLLSVMSSAKGLPKPALHSLKQHNVSLDLLMDKTKPLSARLRELSKVQGDAVAMVNIFGKENMTAAQVVFKNLGTYEKWQATIEKTNAAEKQAAVNSATLSKVIESIKNAFINAVVSGDSLNGTLGGLKTVGSFIANNMGAILKIVTGLIATFLLFKTVVLAVTLITGGYNIAIGIMGALSGTASIAIGQSTLALNAYKIATGIATAAQWLWNAAMTANPIGLIIVGVAALIGFIALIIAKWNEWGAAVSIFLGPIGLVISLVQSFRRNWEMVTEAFKTGGILEGIKAIGKVLLDAVLMPVQQLLELLAKIPGMGGLAGAGAEKIKGLRESMGTLESPESKQVKATANATVNGKVDVDVSTKGGAKADVKSTSKGGIPVRTTSTQGAY